MSLIINAGAGHEPAPEILDTLAEKGVRTTFFLMGWWAERNRSSCSALGRSTRSPAMDTRCSTSPAYPMRRSRQTSSGPTR